MTDILITGANGQLGSSLKALSKDYNSFNFTWIDVTDLELTDEKAVYQFFQKYHFHYIINCAAYAAVDRAEIEKEKAHAINAIVPELLAKFCNDRTRFIHISTDYVYRGNGNLPIKEEDTTDPDLVYGITKLKGEKALWNNPNAMIIRTSWLYSEFGNNFLKTMIRLFNERTDLGVVYDQTGTPTYAGDLAKAILDIINWLQVNSFKSGIYNFSNEGVCSWFDFALEINTILGSKCHVRPIRTEEYPSPAKRPVYSVLDKSKIKKTFQISIPYWRASLLTAINNLIPGNNILPEKKI